MRRTIPQDEVNFHRVAKRKGVAIGSSASLKNGQRCKVLDVVPQTGLVRVAFVAHGQQTHQADVHIDQF